MVLAEFLKDVGGFGEVGDQSSASLEKQASGGSKGGGYCGGGYYRSGYGCTCYGPFAEGVVRAICELETTLKHTGLCEAFPHTHNYAMNRGSKGKCPAYCTHVPAMLQVVPYLPDLGYGVDLLRRGTDHGPHYPPYPFRGKDTSPYAARRQNAATDTPDYAAEVDPLYFGIVGLYHFTLL